MFRVMWMSYEVFSPSRLLEEGEEVVVVEEAGEEEEPSAFEKWLDEKLGEKAEKVVMGVVMAFSFVLAICIFMLLPMFLPFNLLKAGLNTALVLGLYKPLVLALRKAKLVAPRENKGNSRIGVYLLAAGLLATCIVALLVFSGKL